MCDAYKEEEINGEKRILLALAPKLAPIKIAIFPLLKNKPELVSRARKIFDDLKKNWRCEFDDNGNIGKRYRRQDEIGTPFCLTIDFDTIENKDVTVRFRDTMKQERISIDDLQDFFRSHL
jgi:glycyl-tRNA synthetase